MRFISWISGGLTPLMRGTVLTQKRSPVLRGEARPGEVLRLHTDLWPWRNAEAVIWTRDGTPIPGAVGPHYRVRAEDNFCDISCMILTGDATTPRPVWASACTVQYPPPEKVAMLHDEVFDQGQGPIELPTAQTFRGAGLQFAIESDVATIAPDTGILRIDTSAAVEGEPVSVIARNSGGAVQSSFFVTVEAGEMRRGYISNDMWRVHDPRNGQGLRLDILKCPDPGDGALIGFELRAPNGRIWQLPQTIPGWQTVVDWSGSDAPGVVELRALLSTGPGPWSDAQIIAPARAEVLEPPSIEGVSTVGQVLHANPGILKGEGAGGLHIQWLRDGRPIRSATGPRHRLRAHDAGHQIGFEVTYDAGAQLIRAAAEASQVDSANSVWETDFATPQDLVFWATNSPACALSHVAAPENPAPLGTGAMRIEMLRTHKGRQRPQAYLDFEVEPETRYQVLLTLSGKSGGALSRFRVGVSDNPSLNTQQTSGKDYWAKSGSTYSGLFGATFTTGVGQRIARLSLAVTPNTGAFWDYTAVRLENLDGGTAPRPLDGGGGAQARPEDAATYYIDFENGNNKDDGLTPQTAFRTVPPGFIPPGSTLILRGGVRYSQKIRVPNSGTSDLPITFDLTGAHFGNGPAVLDGSVALPGIVPAGILNSAPVHAGPWSIKQDPLAFVLFQQNARIVPAQFPPPRDLDFPTRVGDFLQAEAMTRTTVTSSVFAAMHAMEDITRNTWLRVLGGANAVADLRVVAFDGENTVTLEKAFHPYEQPNRWRFAVVNHPACLTQPGQFIQSGDGKQIILRPHENPDGENDRFSFIQKDANIDIGVSHVRILGGIIEKTRNFGIQAVPPEGQRLRDIHINGVIVRYVAGRRGSALLLERTDKSDIRRCRIENISGTGMRGLRLVNCRDCLVLDNHVDRVVETLLGAYYSSSNCYLIGNHIGDRTGKHGNGITVYWDCHDITIAFNRIRPQNTSLIGITSQNIRSSGAQRGLTIVFNEIVTSVTAIGLWGQKDSVMGWPEKGRNFIANNTLFNTSRSRQYGILFLHDEPAMDTTLINNLAPTISDPQSAFMDQRMKTYYGIDSVRIAEGGRGYAKGDIVTVAGFPALAELKVTTVDAAGAIIGLRVFRSRNNLIYPIPSEGLKVLGGKGKRALVDVTVSPSNLRLRTRNMYHGDAPKYEMKPARRRAFGDIDSYPQIPVADHFADLSGAREAWDLRPGKLDLSRGHAWIFTLPRDKFPNFPKEGIRVDHIGRYRPDGTDVWDWQAQ